MGFSTAATFWYRRVEPGFTCGPLDESTPHGYLCGTMWYRCAGLEGDCPCRRVCSSIPQAASAGVQNAHQCSRGARARGSGQGAATEQQCSSEGTARGRPWAGERASQPRSCCLGLVLPVAVLHCMFFLCFLLWCFTALVVCIYLWASLQVLAFADRLWSLSTCSIT